MVLGVCVSSCSDVRSNPDQHTRAITCYYTRHKLTALYKIGTYVHQIGFSTPGYPAGEHRDRLPIYRSYVCEDLQKSDNGILLKAW